MGWLQLVLIALVSLVFSITAAKYVGPIRNVTVDELLGYAVVVAPDNLNHSQHYHQPVPERLGSAPTDCHESQKQNYNTASSSRCGVSDPSQLRVRVRGVSHFDPAGTDSASSASASSADLGARASPSTLLPDSDFVFVAGTCMKRIRLAFASRSWRGADVRAFLLTDSQSALPLLNERGASAAEAYGFFPSEGAPELGGVVRSLRAGDTRAAVAPFAAHR